MNDPLTRLLTKPLHQRIAAIADDMQSRIDQYRSLDPHKLAEALGVPTPEHPGGDWGFTCYAEKCSVDDQAEWHSPVSEFVYLIEKQLSDDRFQILIEKSADLDNCKRPKFDFLTAIERQMLEEALALEQLEDNRSNGMCCIARFSVQANELQLHFEGEIEDDGECLTLRTPYDWRDKKFTNLENCVTDTW